MDAISKEQSQSKQFKITHKDVIEYMCEKSEKDSLSLTDDCQKKFILEFICQKIGVNEEEISTENLKDLKQTTKTFFARFLGKYRDPKFSRKITRILSDPWALLLLNIPEQFINFQKIGELSEESND